MLNTNKYSRSNLWLYVPLWLFFVYLFVQIVQIEPNKSGGIFLGIMYFIEFGVHEVSHLVVAFLPSILVAAAGSAGELTFTALVAYAAFKSKSYFAGIFGLLWVALAMNSIGMYMADARVQQLQLAGPGSDPQHDWHYVFGSLGWLNADTFIGGFVRGLGDLIGFAALALGFWLLICMLANDKSTPKENDSSNVSKIINRY
ncbi:MAG: hypothetical protein JWL85_481 [Candidatus Saccharibacteria bacterium]|nr:hypothetical protein [Candidatus Saccharibacteria bacterium]